jgi:hypothetical protein
MSDVSPENETRVHEIQEFIDNVTDNNEGATVAGNLARKNEEEMRKLNRQNEFLIQLLRKVTAKLMQNRLAMTKQTLEIQQLRQLMQRMKIAAVDGGCQTVISMKELRNHETGAEAIEDLKRQLKMANATIVSLSNCHNEKRQQLELRLNDITARNDQLNQEMMKMKGHIAYCENELVLKQGDICWARGMQQVLEEFLLSANVDIKSCSKYGKTDITALKEYLKACKPPKLSHVQKLDTICCNVVASMERENIFLSSILCEDALSFTPD